VLVILIFARLRCRPLYRTFRNRCQNVRQWLPGSDGYLQNLLGLRIPIHRSPGIRVAGYACKRTPFELRTFEFVGVSQERRIRATWAPKRQIWGNPMLQAFSYHGALEEWTEKAISITLGALGPKMTGAVPEDNVWMLVAMVLESQVLRKCRNRQSLAGYLRIQTWAGRAVLRPVSEVIFVSTPLVVIIPSDCGSDEIIRQCYWMRPFRIGKTTRRGESGVLFLSA